MNKKLIAAAVAAGLALPMAAQADVTVYGQGQMQIVNHSAQNGAKSYTDMEDGANTKFGMRWSEDLGGGMQAFGDFEWAASMANTTGATKTNGISSRTAYVGLKGGFGTFTFGTVNSAYKTAGGVKYDEWVGTAIEARGHGGMNKTDFTQGAYLSNMIEYSNKFGMANLNIMYSPSKKDDTNDLRHGATGDLAAALTIGFNGGEAGVAYSKDNNANKTTGATGEKNTKVYGKYSFGGTSTVLAQYEQTKYGTGGTDHKTYFLAYQLKMPAMNKLAVQIGQTKNDTGTNPKTSYAAIGIRHSMSKKTSVFAGYMSEKPDGKDNNNVITVGIASAF